MMLNADPNDSIYWREFEKNKITHSAAHYLMAIDALRREFGYARGTDVAERLGVSRGAASMAVSQLKKRQLVSEDAHRFLLLTDEGKFVVDQVEQNFRILSLFFEKVVGVPEDVARADACKMEHLMSLATGRRLVWIMRFIMDQPERIAFIRDVLGRFRPACEDRDVCLLSQSDWGAVSPEEVCESCADKAQSGSKLPHPTSDKEVPDA